MFYLVSLDAQESLEIEMIASRGRAAGGGGEPSFCGDEAWILSEIHEHDNSCRPICSRGLSEGLYGSALKEFIVCRCYAMLSRNCQSFSFLLA